MPMRLSKFKAKPWNNPMVVNEWFSEKTSAMICRRRRQLTCRDAECRDAPLLQITLAGNQLRKDEIEEITTRLSATTAR
jgi:hypothetical protein